MPLTEPPLLFTMAKVELPEYNFVLGKREYNGKYLQVGKDDVIIIEGLHGLNDDLTMSIDRRLKYKNTSFL